jgi:threonine synthase
LSKLILATNENDILSRFFNTGEYRMGEVCETLSPSMDIQVASNFERYLYYRLGGDAAALTARMEAFAKTGAISINGRDPDDLFAAGACGTEGTLAVMRRFHEKHGYVLDPHTAVGVSVALEQGVEGDPVVCLATAHPAKFGDAVARATGRSDLARHPLTDALAGLPTRRTVLPASVSEIRQFVESHVLAGGSTVEGR